MQHSNYFVRVLFGWLPLAAVAAVAIAFVWVAVQQEYRANGNDPQIQIAEDAAAVLSGGADVAVVIPEALVSIETSLMPYVIVYDRNGGPVAGNGSLHGGAPVLPQGVLDEALSSGQNRLTWEPEAGIRQAIVVVPYSSASSTGFVMSGRSLSEAEDRISDLTFMAALALLAALGSTLLLAALKELLVS